MTIQLPKTTYQNILIILSMLNNSFAENEIDAASYTSKPRIEKLISTLSGRVADRTQMGEHNLSIQINSVEAAEVLRACWDTKMLCYRIGGDYLEEFSSRHLRTTLNEIAATLGGIAEL